jgi:hypothetical protein
MPAAFGNSLSLLLLVFLGSFGPSLGRFCSQPLIVRGKAGLKGLLGRLLAWRISIPWYLLLLLGPLTVALVTTVVASLFGGSWPGLGGSQIPEGLPTNLILLRLLPAFLISSSLAGL